MTPTQRSHLAEIAEAAAPPDIAAIYARFRHLTGAPMTALIWRHLATFPGALSEAWAALGPLCEAGLVQEAAWSTAADTVAAPPSSLSGERLTSIGLDGPGLAAYVRVLDAYNRVNPVNFVAVRALARRLADPISAMMAMPRAAWAPPAPIGTLPPMAPVPSLPAEHRRLIDALVADPRLDRGDLVPSLYRHLTGWPALIPAISSDLAPRFASGEIGRLFAAVSAALDRQAEALSAMLPPLARLGSIDGVAETLERFSRLIPEMVVVGLLLRRGFGDGAPDRATR
jgi:hypothetical protein